MQFARFGGAGGRTRTPDLLITNQLLYRLSYTSIFTGQMIIANPLAFVNKNFYNFDPFVSGIGIAMEALL